MHEVSAVVWRMAGVGSVLPRQPKMMQHWQILPLLHYLMKRSLQPLEEQPGREGGREREREREEEEEVLLTITIWLI